MGNEGVFLSGEEGRIQVCARALVIEDKKLLLVGDSPKYWYTPGGRLEVGESLADCVVREVFEETGLRIKVGRLVHVFEFHDVSEGSYKVECYFLASIKEGCLSSDWKDMGGEIRYRHFFTLDEVRQKKNVFPQFLSEGLWLEENETGKE